VTVRRALLLLLLPTNQTACRAAQMSSPTGSIVRASQARWTAAASRRWVEGHLRRGQGHPS
jgi:hypothetical protein